MPSIEYCLWLWVWSILCRSLRVVKGSVNRQKQIIRCKCTYVHFGLWVTWQVYIREMEYIEQASFVEYYGLKLAYPQAQSHLYQGGTSGGRA